jgi:hypothetical protein
VSNCAVLYKIIRMIVFVFWQIGKDSLWKAYQTCK